MADELLNRAGLFFDELNKLRVCDPNGAQSSEDLKNECTDFLAKLDDFQKVTDGFSTLVDDLAKRVEQEKMNAIGSRNLLNSAAKQGEVEKQRLETLIAEKQVELERLRIQYEAQLREEREQKEYLQQILSER